MGKGEESPGFHPLSAFVTVPLRPPPATPPAKKGVSGFMFFCIVSLRLHIFGINKTKIVIYRTIIDIFDQKVGK